MHLDEPTAARYAAQQYPPEQEAQLSEHLAGCPLCARRVESYRLRAQERTRSLPPVPLPVSEPSLPPPAPGLKRHEQVGRYIILHALGEGGMGVVYAAYDPELDRKVALKLLRASTQVARGQSDGHARLLREAQAMARISHPHVVAVHDVGTYGDRVFMAMEYVEGSTLRHWLQQAPRPWRQVLEAFLAAGRGLAAAHAVGLVHRDFKPDNVLVNRDGRVLVTDFGLARLIDDEEPASDEGAEDSVVAPAREGHSARLHESLTQPGRVVGTLYYMAPEQHHGRPADARSDQFSFCAALYYALYGQRPFQPERLAGAAPPPLEGHSVTAPLSGPVRQPPGIIQEPPAHPRLPRWLKRAMLRGLALAPEQRFASMEELLESLSGPPASVRRTRRAASVALALGLTALGVGLVRHRQAPCQDARAQLAGIWDRAVKQRVKAAFEATGRPYAATTWAVASAALEDYTRQWVAHHTEACEATRVRATQSEHLLTLRMTCLERRRRNLQALSALWAQADGPVVERAVDAVASLPPLAACEDVQTLTLRMPPPGTPHAQAEIQRIGALISESHVQEGAGRYAQARERARQAVADARTLGYPPLLAEALLRLASVHALMAEAREATRVYLEALQAAEVGRDDEARAQASAGLVGSVGYSEGRVEEGLMWAGLTRALLERLGGRERIEINLMGSLTGLYARAGRQAEARQAAERSIALTEKLLGRESIWRVRYLGNLSGTYLMAGDYAQARSILEEALAQVERIAGPDHPDEGRLLGNLSEVALAQGDLEAALAYGRRALALTEVSLGPDSPKVGMLRHTLASTLSRQGHHERALEEFQRALTIVEAGLGATHPNVAQPLEGLARLHLETQRPADALPLLERALTLKVEPSMMADLRLLLARTLRALQRDPARARKLAQQALEGYEASARPQQAKEVRSFLAGLGARG